MKYENDLYIINYNECDKEYINKMINFLNVKFYEILDFFGLNKLSKKLEINIFDELDKYVDFTGEIYADWEVGRVIHGEIAILSYKEIIKRKGHYNDKVDAIFGLVCHEFVHYVHLDYLQKIGKKNYFTWVAESLACIISGQYSGKEFVINDKLENIMNEGKINYITFYTMGCYVLKLYGKEYYLRLATDFDFAVKETPKIYEEAKKWCENIRVK